MIGKTLSQCKALSKLGKVNCETQFPVGKLVSGEVLAKGEMYALLNVGLATKAIMPNNGLWGFEHLSVGDYIKVYIEEVNENEDYAIVSRRQLDETERWEFAEQLCKSCKEINAPIVKLTRRGIRLKVYDLMGAMFWTKELIELENEIRSKSTLMVRVSATCERYNMIVLTPSRPIEDTIRRKTSAVVWTNVIGLCDLGLWTHVDACNGVITLSGRPWCCALDVVNQLPFGKLVISNFVKMGNALRPLQTGDCVDLIVNFMLEVDKSLDWERSVAAIDVACVWNWAITLTVNERERWHDWRELGINCIAVKFERNAFDGPSKVVLSAEAHEEIDETNARQNVLWDKERLSLAEMLCGFEFKRFKLTELVLSKVRKGQLCAEDESWLWKIENAWLLESGKLISFKTKWRMNRIIDNRKRVIARLKATKRKSCNWNEEFDYSDMRELKDAEIIGKLNINTEAKGKPQNAGKPNETEEWRSLCKRGNFRENEKVSVAENETLPIVAEMKLDDEWGREWESNREPNYRRKHYEETDCALIETSYGRFRGVRILRPAYAVIVGMDVQVTLLTVAVTRTILAYVCDLSITTEEVATLERNWKSDLALKTAPIGLNFGIDDVMVEIDVLGYKYLQFVNENWEQTLIGIVAKVNANDVTIALANELYGTLRFDLPTVNFEIEVGMKIDVAIVDFNPVNNVINLDIASGEEANALLVEATAKVNVTVMSFVGRRARRKKRFRLWKALKS
ncbi:MAG: hypothetical protein ACEY26_00480 [Candidatus Hodgkinia cicadicola]